MALALLRRSAMALFFRSQKGPTAVAAVGRTTVRIQGGNRRILFAEKRWIPIKRRRKSACPAGLFSSVRLNVKKNSAGTAVNIWITAVRTNNAAVVINREGQEIFEM